jgi:hypothetical protein
LLIVEYYIYHIIINTHVDDDVMAQNMTYLVGTPAYDQTFTLPHGISPYWARGPGAHFVSITFFRGMIFGQVMAKIRHGGGSSTVVVSAILGGCSVWFFGVTNE